MPWELLSRLRHSVRRQTAPEPSLQDTPPKLQEEHPSQHAQLPIDRKILQDPSSLLETEATPERVLPLGLTPSTRLPSGDGRHARRRPKQIDLSLEPLSERSALPSIDISPRTPSRFTISRISRIAGGGEWSTFGRKRENRVPDAVDISPPDDPQRTSHSPSPARGAKHLSVDSVASIFTLSRVTNPSVAHGERLDPVPRQSLDHQSGRKRASPTDTTSSKTHPQTPQRPSSPTAPAAPATSSLMHSLTPENTAVDSPHTFGYPTPPNNPVESSPSRPPPLPSLDHQELALPSRGQSLSIPQPPTSAFCDRTNTLPTNDTPSRKDELFKSLSLKLRRSLKHRSSPPEAEQVSALMEEHETRSQDAAHRRRRARTMSADVRRRRTSADWNSYQASVAANAWPTEVSREMVRLSLRETPRRAGPDSVPGSAEKRKPRTRGKATDPGRRPDRGASSFLPFPHPSRPVSPPPTASATPAGRETTQSRLHSFQSDLGNRRGSQRSTRFMTTTVKRSMSAIESRNGRRKEASGAPHPSLGLSDPDRSQSRQAAPLLHPSSALTPSRALLSGRLSPTDSPMAPSVEGDPSTPTPAPRHHSMSDKSRGKRKAEDIDLTPPEQKKEGQRATFLLPSETRSQRVSNASHAPSSYHRKRARLSSTSPFATPTQSRPSSLHETPRSTSRNHHFSSLSSHTGARLAPPRTPSRAASTRSRQPPPTPSTTRKHERHQSMSQISIPISAIVSPHAPSISRSAKFHMRDPRKPPRRPDDTPWSLRFATEDELASPIQAWCFFFGFLLFPIWWIAGLFLPIPRTRIAGDVDAEKGVAIDDPQIEHDARTWRFRCRVMAVISLFTYIPFIVLVAIFAPR